MPRAHALILEKIHHTADEGFAPSDVVVHRVDRGLGEAELISTLRELPDEPCFVGIRSKTKVTARVFAEVPKLIGVGAFCIGTDQIDLAAARARGVAVFNAPFSNTRSVAELVMAEVVMLSRQIFARSGAAHKGVWMKSADGAHEVRGKTLGIVGYGHIGTQLSILAEAFGMRVIFFDIEKKLPLGNARSELTLTEMLGQADFVTLHVPDTDNTRNMISVRELQAMKAGAYLINASRGKVVDIPALGEAIRQGRLGGAAIDVFPREPKSNDDRFESELQGLENVILTPHIGGSTQEAQANIGTEVSAALVKYLERGSTGGCVNLPAIDVPLPGRGSRIVNLHRNQPGVLSRINQVIAASNVNIVGQSLGTLDDVGLLTIDIPVVSSDPQAAELKASIAALETSIRTRLLSG